MIPSVFQLTLLAFAWLAYFALHSLLASLGLKNWMANRHPQWMPAYRLLFNVLAVVLLLIPLSMLYSFQGPPLWQWQGFEKLISNTLRLAAIIGFVWTFKYYDGSEIVGVRQLRQSEQSVNGQENFCISPFHRYVRHPWYFFSLIFIWAGNMEPAWLVSAVMLSLYFIIGSRLEERKLLAYHGDIYARYLRAVPGLMPLPWRYLSRVEAKKLVADSYAQKSGN